MIEEAMLGENCNILKALSPNAEILG